MAAEALFGPRQALRRLVDSINEVGPPAALSHDANLAAAFADVMRRHGELEPIEVTDEAARRIRAVLSRLYGVFGETEADAAAAGLNRLLADHAAPPRLSNEQGTAWHLHVDPQTFSWDSWLAASGAFALALLLASHGRPAWGVCAAPGCGRVFVSDGRGRPRRACSERCATRLRVAAHRARKAARSSRPASDTLAATCSDAMRTAGSSDRLTKAAGEQRSTVELRPVRPDEGEPLREIARAAKGYWGYDPDRVSQWAATLDLSAAGLRQKEFHVAEVDGRIVGWSALILKEDVCWLDDLWIEPQWIGKGTGGRLFEHAVERGRQLGARRMEWEAERHALGFYEKMGGRYLRDSEPGVWGRVNPIMGVDLGRVAGGALEPSSPSDRARSGGGESIA